MSFWISFSYIPRNTQLYLFYSFISLIHIATIHIATAIEKHCTAVAFTPVMILYLKEAVFIRSILHSLLLQVEAVKG